MTGPLVPSECDRWPLSVTPRLGGSHRERAAHKRRVGICAWARTRNTQTKEGGFWRRVFPQSWPQAGSLAALLQIIVGAGALAIADILLACWLFLRVYKRAVRTGLIVRYSAESVS